MNVSTPPLTTFESHIQTNPSLHLLWKDFFPCINSTLTDVDKARFAFCNALKITHQVAKNEEIKAIWIDLLRQGSFTLCLKGLEPRIYNFNAIIGLAESNNGEFVTELVKFDPQKNDLLAAATDINHIFLESVGQTAEIKFLQEILTSKDTFCLVVKTKETLIACSYGTQVNVDGMDIFHLNIQQYHCV